jgi:hypothetical protein
MDCASQTPPLASAPPCGRESVDRRGKSKTKGVLHVEQIDASKCYHCSSREEAQDFAALHEA